MIMERIILAVVVVFVLLILVIFLRIEEKFLTNDDSSSCWLMGPPSQDDPRVIEILRNKFLMPPSKQAYNLTKPKPNWLDIYYYPDSSYEVLGFYLKQFFSDQKHGFFVEAGALDGQSFSNSLWLEKELGWNGLLVEADPNNYRHLVEKRRKAWTSNTCISRFPYPQEITFEALQSINGILPRVYPANSRPMSSPFRTLDDKWNRDSAKSYFKNQCFPLSSYLIALNVTTLDLLILDIQGHEWEVIKTLLLDEITVRVMIVEYFSLFPNGTMRGNIFDKDFAGYMETIGYQLVELDEEGNYIMVLKKDAVLHEKIDPKHLVKYKKTQRFW